MEAPAPQATWSGRHAVEVYVRTYSTMLQSSGEIRVESLEQAHIGMESALHALAGDARVDMGALIYSARRLPSAIARSRRVLLSQSPEGFRSALGVDVLSWQQVEAPARRRRWYYDGDGTLAVLLASHSDIDDLVPSLVAYQLEWNKMHRVLVDAELDPERARRTVEASEADWARLREAWAPNFEATLAAVRRAECHITLRMVGGTHVGYSRAFHRWWAPVAACLEELGLSEAPIYFVSSNLHSLINVLSGVARRFENEIHDFVRSDDPDLYNELRKLEAGQSRGSRDNWLYFAARRIFDHHQRAEEFRQRRVEFENEVGIRHVSARAGVDSSAQIFKLQDLDPTCFD